LNAASNAGANPSRVKPAFPKSAATPVDKTTPALKAISAGPAIFDSHQDQPRLPKFRSSNAVELLAEMKRAIEGK
jgi:hypothetical protein